MDELLKHFYNIYAIDWPTMAVTFGLCAATALAIREYLAFPILAMLTLPVLFFASICIQYLFTIGEIYIPTKLDQWLMWTVIASLCGNMIGIALVAAVGRLKDHAVPLHRPARRPGKPEIRY